MALGVAGASGRGESDGRRVVRLWLAIVAVMVVAMVAVGGATRLTDSGLSITEWQPIIGAIPPLGEADWQAAFAKYKQIPEYREVNKGMTLEAFKTIFWWEWGHRFLGRLIGLAFALPLVWLWASGRVPRGYGWPLIGLLALGGLQGFVGWYMVQSGLTDRVDVSQYRLAMHLCMAFLILGLLVWLWRNLANDGEVFFKALPGGTWLTAQALVVLVFVQVALGAFVAGTKAGLDYTTWPLMDGEFIPSGLFPLSPWYMNLFEDHLTVQFNHRMMAYVLVGLALVHAVRLAGIDNDHVQRSAWLLAGLMLAQAGLGVWTLVSVDGAIPLGLGVAHQTLAAIVFAASVLHVHAVYRARSG